MSSVISRLPTPTGSHEYFDDVDLQYYPSADWVHDPDISAVENVDELYWRWDEASQAVVEMTAAEQDAVDNSSPDATTTISPPSTPQPVDNSFSRTFNGSRVYLITQANYARTFNTSYGPSYYHWASAIQLSNIHYRCQGIERKGAFRAKSFSMDGFFSTGSLTTMKVHILKLRRNIDAWSANNSVVWTSDEISSSATSNRQYDFELPNLEYQDQESLGIAWERTDTGGGTRYFYFDELRFDLERI